MSLKYPIGSVVCLRSNPEVPMTVISYNGDIIRVLWLDVDLKAQELGVYEESLKLYC